MLEQIKASAGSGKTYALTRRFLELLRGASAQGAPPVCALSSDPAAPYALAEILAATFTNKAAAEMKSRVLRDLKALALGLEKDPDRLALFSREEATAWVETILRRFDSLNIRTIDSLLTLLVRLSALSLNLPPDFSPVFDDAELFDPLYDALLDSAARGNAELRDGLRQACRALVLHGEIPGFMPGGRLRKRLLEIVTLALHNELPLPDAAVLEQVQARRTVLRQDLADAAKALAALLQEENLTASVNFLTFLRNCAALEIRGKIPESVYASKADLDDCLLKAAKGKASADSRASFRELCATYERATSLDPLYRSAAELGPLALLAAPLAQALTTTQEEEGRVSARLLPHLAERVVSGEGGVSDAFCRLGNRLSHLLFDEFQDTSRAQWASIAPLAVESLSRGGSLTYVGDVKQAIYSWRGGDAALFDEVARNQELTAMLPHGPSVTSLDRNWRSGAAVVGHNNAVFSRLADPVTAKAVASAMLADDTPPDLLDQAARTLCRTFTGTEQELPPQALSRSPGLVRLTRIQAAGAEELREEVAERLRALLDEVLQRHAPRDVAILVRRNTEAADMAALLASWKLPVVTEHSFQLGRHPLIARLTDFLAFLEYPPDDAAFWSFISGPECFPPLSGISHEALSNWLAAVRARPDAIPLARGFRRDFPAAWERVIAPFYDRAGLMSAYDTIQESIRRFGLLERLPEHAPFLRRFLEVAHAAEGKGASSLSAFLEFWESSGVEEKVPMPEGMDAVRILTMHKAKGLEFPVVIVPFHHHTDPPDSAITPALVEGLPLLVRRAKQLGAAYYETRLRAALEGLNLLYVAWTRPTRELHAFLTGTGRSQRSSGLAKALDILLADLPFTDDVHETGQADPARTESPSEASQAPMTPLPSSSGVSDDAAPPMHWLPRLKIFRNTLAELEFTERRRGMLAHSCLEALRPGDNSQADVERAIRHGLLTFPLSVPDPESVFRELSAMLSWYVALPRTAAWLAHGAPEQSVMDGAGHLHRVDLLVDDGDAGLLTVEYKTGRPDPAHAAQVKRYLGLLRAATDRPARGVLVYLDLRTVEDVT